MTTQLRLSPGAVSRFRRDGFCVGRGILESSLIDAFVSDVTRAVQAQLDQRGLSVDAHAAGDDTFARLLALHAFDEATYLATLRVASRFKSLYDLFLSDAIAIACRQLGVALPMMHTFPLVHIISRPLSIESGYLGFEAHQDWHAIQTSLNTVVVWTPLHDIDVLRHPLEVLRGSHRRGLLQANPDVTGEFETVTVDRGDVVFFSPFLVHRTKVTAYEGLRLAVSWRYEDAAEPTFVRRRYPLAQGKTIAERLFTPGFPDADEMERVLSRLE